MVGAGQPASQPAPTRANRRRRCARRPRAPTIGPVELVGTLSFSSLSDLMLLLAASEQTGVLRLGADCEVWYFRGDLSYASYDGCRPLRDSLLGAKVIDEAQWEEAVHAGADGGTGAAIDDLAGVSRTRLRAVMRERIVETILPYLDANNAPATFEAGMFHGFGPRCRVPVELAVMEAAMRRRRWRELADSVPSFTSVPCRSGLDNLAEPDDLWLLDYVDGDRSVAQLIELTGCSAYSVCATLEHLVHAGAVEFVALRTQLVAH